MVRSVDDKQAGLPVLNGRTVYTRAHLVQRHPVGLSTLEGWWRDRKSNGHPAAVGKIGRSLAWDALEWDRWYADRDGVGTLVTIDDIAGRHGVSPATAWAWIPSRVSFLTYSRRPAAHPSG